MLAGQWVRLLVPDNPTLDGALAQIETLTGWGAHVHTDAAATGRFRALHEEMATLDEMRGIEAAPQLLGYSGDACDRCGAFMMKRTGPCLTCENCGASGGC